MPFLRTALFAAAAVVAAHSSLSAQRAMLHAEDLVYRAEAADPYLEIVRTGILLGARRFVGETHLGGITPPDELIPPPIGFRGHFTEDRLEELLQRTGPDSNGLVRDGRILVAEQHAKATQKWLADLRAVLPPTIRATIRVTQTVNGTTRLRLSREVDLAPGRLGVISDATSRPALISYDVEIANASTIANPIVSDVAAGTMIAIRPQMPPSGEWALLEMIVRCIDDQPDEPPLDTNHAVGPIDRVTQDVSETGRVLRVRPGMTSVHRWSDGRSSFEVSLSTQWKLPGQIRPGGRDVGVFSVRAPLTGFRSEPVPWDGDENRGYDKEIDPAMDVLSELAGGDVEILDMPDSELLGAQRYVAVGPEMWSLAAAVSKWFESFPPAPTLSVRLFDVAAGEPWPNNNRPSEDMRPLGATRIEQVQATWSTTAVRREFTTVRDWDCEVAQASRIPTPRCARVSTGLVLNARLFGNTLELDGELSRVRNPGRKELTLNAPLLAPDVRTVRTVKSGRRVKARDTSTPEMILTADDVAVDHPVVASVGIRLRRELPANGPLVYRSSASTVLAEERELLVVISRE